MSFAGTWKRGKTEGGEAFFKAFNAPDEKLKKAASAELTSTVVENGDSIKITRVYTLGG